MNTNTNADSLRDPGKVNAGLGTKEGLAVARQAPLPHAIPRIDVSSLNGSANNDNKKRTKNPKQTQPVPTVPDDIKREARIGGTIALLFAAGISAQTLFQLGRLIGLSPWTAWMLPGAFDIYAFESARVASRVPVGHHSRGWAVWNARLALSFTVIGNALFHALYLSAHGHGWSKRDIALTAMSAVPPIIVERLLHLQTKVNDDGPATHAATSVAGSATAATATGTVAPATRPAVAQPGPATPKPQPVATPPATRPVAEAGNSNAVAALVPKEEQLEIVRNLVAEHGPGVPLADIQELIGGHKSTASRLRKTVVAELGENAEGVS